MNSLSNKRILSIPVSKPRRWDFLLEFSGSMRNRIPQRERRTATSPFHPPIQRFKFESTEEKNYDNIHLAFDRFRMDNFSIQVFPKQDIQFAKEESFRAQEEMSCMER